MQYQRIPNFSCVIRDYFSLSYHTNGITKSVSGVLVELITDCMASNDVFFSNVVLNFGTTVVISVNSCVCMYVHVVLTLRMTSISLTRKLGRRSLSTWSRWLSPNILKASWSWSVMFVSLLINWSTQNPLLSWKANTYTSVISGGYNHIICKKNLFAAMYIFQSIFTSTSENCRWIYLACETYKNHLRT